nr:mucin-5AC isoform X4 [Crassostrea gigas]
MHYLAYQTAFLLICVLIEKALQQLQPAYIHQNHQGCLNIPIIGVDVSGTFLIMVLFKGSAPVCTMARLFNGANPLVEIDANYIGRVACVLDEANNRVNLCFISSVSLSDGGIYFASTSTSSANTLYVMAQPRKPTIITENTIISGTVQTFTCSTTSTSNPAPGLPLTYSWFVNYAPVNDPRFSVTGNGRQALTIDKVQKQDKGTTLRCVANEEKGLTSEHSDLKTLDVLYVPDVVISPGSNIVTQVNAASVTVECLVKDANPNTDLAFSWTKDSIQISSSQTYIIMDVQLSNKGTYSCTCSNTAGTSKPAFVTVEVNEVSSITSSVSTLDDSTTSIFQTTDFKGSGITSSVPTTDESTAQVFKTTDIPSSTPSISTVVVSTNTMLTNTDELDTAGIPNTTQFLTPVNGSRTSDEEDIPSSTSSISTVVVSTNTMLTNTDELDTAGIPNTTQFLTPVNGSRTSDEEETPSSTSSISTVVVSTNTLLTNTDELDTAGIPNTTQFLTPVNGSRTSDEEEAISSTLLYGTIAGSLGLFFGGLVLFIISAKRCCKLQGNSKKNNPYVMEELWRVNSHHYTKSPFEQKINTQRDNSSNEEALPDYVVMRSDDVYEESHGNTQNEGFSHDDETPEYMVISDDIYEESLDPYLTAYYFFFINQSSNPIK